MNGKLQRRLKVLILTEILLGVLELKGKEKASSCRKGKKKLERVGKRDLVSYPQRGEGKGEEKAKRVKERKREELLRQKERRTLVGRKRQKHKSEREKEESCEGKRKKGRGVSQRLLLYIPQG